MPESKITQCLIPDSVEHKRTATASPKAAHTATQHPTSTSMTPTATFTKIMETLRSRLRVWPGGLRVLP